MRRRRIDFESEGCPFIDLNDPLCAGHFKLNHLDEAFGQCLGNYHACPIHQRIVDRGPSTVRLTIAGTAPAMRGVALRATGS